MSGSLHWVPHLFSIELKKLFSYRLNFWMQFLMGSATELSVSYFLWRAIFEQQGAEELGGMPFGTLFYYYIFAGASQRIGRGSDRGYISEEIYQGTLTRYLLYPLPFFGYKYVVHVSQQLIGACQLLLVLAFAFLFVGPPPGDAVSPGSFLAGCATLLLTGLLGFVMMGCIEMVAFWQDVIWNLMAMFRFCGSLLGGALVPLVFFPDWGRGLVRLTPFPILIDFPARVFLGRVGLSEWAGNAALLLLWTAALALLARRVWRRGLMQYSGVGA